MSRQERPFSSVFAAWELSDAIREGFVQPRRPRVSGPLKEVFEREGARGEAVFVLDNGEFEIRFELLRSSGLHSGHQFVRLFFINPQRSMKKVILDIDSQKFQISKIVDTSRESIPISDYGEARVGGGLSPMFLLHKGDIKEAAKGRRSSIRVKSFYLRRIAPVREVSVYSRPIYYPPQILGPRGEPVSIKVKPDYSIREVRTFSDRAIVEIFNQLDPRIAPKVDEHGPRFELKPTLIPAIEIAELIGQHLGLLPQE